MKTPYNSVLAAILILISMIGAQPVQAKVPAEVKKALLNSFPNAQRIAWKHYLKDEYQATFMVNEDEAHIFVGHHGEFIESYVQLHEEHIPQELLAEIKEIEDETQVHYVLRTTNAAGVMSYKTKAKINEEVYELVFDEHYVLTSKTFL